MTANTQPTKFAFSLARQLYRVLASGNFSAFFPELIGMRPFAVFLIKRSLAREKPQRGVLFSGGA